MLNPRYSMTAGKTGPTLLQDVDLIDKLQNFDREQIAPRNVHAQGVGAFGKFKASSNVSKYTFANLFKQGTETPIFVRFSGVFTGREEAETVRDMRGFALKFYTKKGNWDLLTVNIPVFGVQDAMTGPDAIHAFKRDPRTGEWNTDTVWDFVANHPEALHQTLLLLMDQYGTPISYRNMNTFACNTFSFLNKEGVRHWVRFQLVSDLPKEGLDAFQAKIIAGEDPDFLRKDLRHSIERGDHPNWKLCFQIMPESEGYKNASWAFDPSRFWPINDYPLYELGTIELDRMPTDHYTQTEQVAFSPANVVPGIGFSPDQLLQGRLFIYADTQFHRLGPNFRQIPINCPKNSFATPYYGGPHRSENAHFPVYFPSEFGGLQAQSNPIEAPVKCSDSGHFPPPEVSAANMSYNKQILESWRNARPNNHLAFNVARSFLKITNQNVLHKALKMIRDVDGSLGREVEQWMEMGKRKDREVMGEGMLLVEKMRHNLEKKVFQVCD